MESENGGLRVFKAIRIWKLPLKLGLSSEWHHRLPRQAPQSLSSLYWIIFNNSSCFNSALIVHYVFTRQIGFCRLVFKYSTTSFFNCVLCRMPCVKCGNPAFARYSQLALISLRISSSATRRTIDILFSSKCLSSGITVFISILSSIAFKGCYILC